MGGITYPKKNFVATWKIARNPAAALPLVVYCPSLTELELPWEETLRAVARKINQPSTTGIFSNSSM
jgi:hypothetical protein